MNLPSLSFDVSGPFGFYAGPKDACAQLAIVESNLAAKRKERTSVLFGWDFLRGSKNKAIDDQIERLKGEKAKLKKLCKAGVSTTGAPLKAKGGGGKAKSAGTATAALDPALDPALAVTADSSATSTYLIGGVLVLGVLGVIIAMVSGGKKPAPQPASRFGP